MRTTTAEVRPDEPNKRDDELSNRANEYGEETMHRGDLTSLFEGSVKVERKVVAP